MVSVSRVRYKYTSIEVEISWSFEVKVVAFKSKVMQNFIKDVACIQINLYMTVKSLLGLRNVTSLIEMVTGYSHNLNSYRKS